MAKFIIDTIDNNISKSMLEMILENHLDYNVYVKEIKPIDENELDELASKYGAEIGDPMNVNDCKLISAAILGFNTSYRKAKEE